MTAPATTYAIEVETSFAAAHAIVLAGERERVHGHNWRVQVSIAGERLDREELLCDFHALEAHLREITAPFRDGYLNETPPFDRINPTAEALARHVARELSVRVASMAPGLHVEWARVTEAPNCIAVARMARPGGTT